MPEHTPKVDIEALAKAVYELRYNNSPDPWEWERGWRRDSTIAIVRTVCDRRDQDWQTAQDARITAARGVLIAEIARFDAMGEGPKGPTWRYVLEEVGDALDRIAMLLEEGRDA